MWKVKQLQWQQSLKNNLYPIKVLYSHSEYKTLFYFAKYKSGYYHSFKIAVPESAYGKTAYELTYIQHLKELPIFNHNNISVHYYSEYYYILLLIYSKGTSILTAVSSAVIPELKNLLITTFIFSPISII